MQGLPGEIGFSGKPGESGKAVSGPFIVRPCSSATVLWVTGVQPLLSSLCPCHWMSTLCHWSLKGIPGKDGLDGLPGNDGAMVCITFKSIFFPLSIVILQSWINPPNFLLGMAQIWMCNVKGSKPQRTLTHTLSTVLLSSSFHFFIWVACILYK